MKWPLRKKLYVAFGSVIVMFALVSGFAGYSFSSIGRSLGSYDNGVALMELTHEVGNELAQARLAAETFFGEESDDELAKAAREHIEGIDRRTESIGRLGADLGSDATRRAAEDLRVAARAYLQAFDKAAAAFATFGRHDSGYHGEFRKAARELEEASHDINDTDLTVLILQMRRAEKDFLQRGAEKYVEVYNDWSQKARRHLTVKVDNADRRQVLLGYLGDYVSYFNKAAAARVEFVGLRVKMAERSAAVQQAVATAAEVAQIARHEAAGSITGLLRQTQLVFLVTFVLVLFVSLGVSRVLSGQMSELVGRLVTAMGQIARGDLTVKVEINSQDELGLLGRSMNDMITALRDITSQVSTAASSLAEMASELSSSVSEQGAAMQQQASAVAETVSTMEEITRASNQVLQTATAVMEKSESSVRVSGAGQDALRQSVDGMASVREQVQNIAATILELSEKTQQIGSIIATVDDFAEQSSLLALNASIEAARAGEEGKAFSVVAGQVKNLAEQSRQATERVRSILNEIQSATHAAVMVTEEGSKRVDRGVDLIRNAGGLLDELANTILTSADSARQITAVAQQQVGGVEQIATAMSGVDEFSKQNIEAIGQTETASQNLSSVATQLNGVASVYRLH